MGSHIVVTSVWTLASCEAKSRQQYFIRTRALRRLMASATPPEIRRAGGVNRWTLEPLLIVLPWILALASTFLVIVLAMAGLGAALAVVVILSLWVAAAVGLSRVQSVKNPP